MIRKVEFENESELALNAAYMAGELLEAPPGSMSVTLKGSLRDVVTDLDYRIERYLTNQLSTSGHPVVGEETFKDDSGFQEPNGPFWLIDPIDGTANFISGFPHFGVSVGFCDFSDTDDRFILGAISLPATKELFFTYGDSASFLNGRTLKLNGTTLELKDSLVNFSFAGKSSDPKKNRNQYELFGQVNQVSRGALRIGSAAAAICQVAAGRLQAAVGIDCRFWDVAAAIAIARLAGADIHTLRERGSSRISFVLGHPRVVKTLRDILEKAEVLA